MNEIFKLSLRISHMVCDLTVFVFEPPVPMLQAAFCRIDCQSVPRLHRCCRRPAVVFHSPNFFL